MKAFSNIPFLRLTIPLIIGILIAFKIDTRQNFTPYLLLFFIPFVFFNFSKTSPRAYKWLFTLFADLFLILLGLQLTQLKKASNSVYYYGNQIHTDSVVKCLAMVNDLPVRKTNFTKYELNVLAVKSGTQFIGSEGNLIAYVKTKKTDVFRPGTLLFISAQFNEIPEPKNPMEFDYREYLKNKQVFHTVFLDSVNMCYLYESKNISLIWKFGLICKDYVLSRLKTSGLTDQAYGICAALLTGYDDDIDKTVMDAFSHSGTLHVLSVSGLHTGLIYLCLNFLFDVFDKKRRYKLLRLSFMTLFLWFFALITGFSAPVLRAVIMFNLLGIGRAYFRGQSRNQINILLVSAFILLCYNPFYLLDVGFQLSYMALFGILYFQPKFYVVWQAQNKILDYSWQSVSASFAATLSTLPLTLFYFKQFPLWFFICNLVVVPATFLLLFLALAVILKIGFLVPLINMLTTGLLMFIQLFNSDSSGYIDNIDFTFSDACFLSILLFLLTVSFQYRSYKYLIFSLSLLIVWQSTCLISSYTSKSQKLLTVYHIKKGQAVSVKNKTKLSLCLSDSSIYKYHIKPHLISLNYVHVNQETFNCLKRGEDLTLFLNKPGFWPKTDFAEVTTLVLSNNFKLTDKDVLAFKKLKTLVSDASNNHFAVTNALELSRKFGFNFYTIRTEGAYLSELP